MDYGFCWYDLGFSLCSFCSFRVVIVFFFVFDFEIIYGK